MFLGDHSGQNHEAPFLQGACRQSKRAQDHAHQGAQQPVPTSDDQQDRQQRRASRRGQGNWAPPATTRWGPRKVRPVI